MPAVAAGDLRVVNPATLELVATVPVTPPEAIHEAVAEARLVDTGSLEDRRRLLLAVAEVLLDRLDEVADTICAETGKPRTEAFTTELFVAVDSLLWLAAEAPALLAPERLRFQQLHLRHKRGWFLYEP